MCKEYLKLTINQRIQFKSVKQIYYPASSTLIQWSGFFDKLRSYGAYDYGQYIRSMLFNSDWFYDIQYVHDVANVTTRNRQSYERYCYLNDIVNTH